MGPFSITAGAIGITGFATTSILQLHDLINGLAEAKDNVADVASSLENIRRPLALLDQLSIADETTSIVAREDLAKAGVAEAVNRCGDACDEFSRSLKKWTRHSPNAAEKLSLRDHLSVGLWNKEKIRTFRTQLQSCEATVQFAVTVTQLKIQLRSDNLSEIDRGHWQSLESEIRGHLALMKTQIDEATERKQQLQQGVDPDPDDERLDAISEVEKRLRLLEATQVSCGIVFAQTESMRSGQDISKVFTSDKSKAQVGMTESVVGKINQRLTDVRTVKDSRAIVGIFGNDVRMSDF